MSHDPASSSRTKPGGKALGWALLVVGILLCLGFLGALTNGDSGGSEDAARTAGALVGRVIILAVGVIAIIFGTRRLRR